MRAKTLILAGIFALSASLLMNGQQGVSSSNQADAKSGETNASQPQLQERYPRYVIRKQDKLQLTFPLTPELNEVGTVQPDGFLNLKNTASVHVEGLTVPQLVVELKKAYLGILRNPIISVDLTDFQQPYFTASGQVGKPGKYELRTDITATEAIAIAGGLLPTAKSQVFLLHKTSDQWFKVEKFDIKNVLNGRNISEDVLVRPGDMVYVPESAITKFRKYVPYSVNAGSYVSDQR
jgi:polysaccharide biosynthesis/export protein